ncbi:MAG: pilus assembly protein TadG-related protein [Gemmatimonadota bacterium]|nr:pilus assembly protein TadG-related protein [Gemmatimonadota bacterium]
MRRLLGDDRGAVSAFIAMGMVVFLGAAAISIDVGHVMNVRTESQRVADLAALAGASAFIDGTVGTAALQNTIESRATSFAGQNTVDRTSVTLPVGDIDIDFANERVRVTVRHTTASGNAIPTIFARVLGINSVDVVTTAVAEAYPAAGAKCILPFMLPDKYAENGGDPYRYDAPPDYYEAFDPDTQSPTATGYTDADKGLQLVIKPSQGNTPAQPNPSWYYPLAIYKTGGSAYRDAIAGCIDPNAVFAIGDPVDVEPGAMIGPTQQGVNLLVAQAPTHEWSVANKCVIDGGPTGDPNICVGSPRLRPVPMMAPPDAPGNGRTTVPIMNWAGVFVEGMSGNDVVVRFAGYSGFAVATGGSGGGSGALPKLIRLVE